MALPGGEIVPAAQRGTIDAAEWIGPADDLNLGLQTVWKNYYLQGLHQSTDIGEVLINKTFWDKLPADIQEIVRTAAMASMTETYTFNVYRNAQAVIKLRNEFKVTIHDTPKDFFPEFVKATNVVLDRYAGRTSSSRRCWTRSATSRRSSCRTGPRSSTSTPSSATRRCRTSSTVGEAAPAAAGRYFRERRAGARACRRHPGLTARDHASLDRAAFWSAAASSPG